MACSMVSTVVMVRSSVVPRRPGRAAHRYIPPSARELIGPDGSDWSRAGRRPDDGAMSSPTLDRLTADLTTAMKARDSFRTNTIRQAIGAVRAESKAGPVEKELSED